MKVFGSIHHVTDPGKGVSVTLPVGYNIYVLANVSVLYTPGNQKEDSSTGKRIKDFYETGINGSLQFAYYISSVAMTLAFGYRYQYNILKHITKIMMKISKI